MTKSIHARATDNNDHRYVLDTTKVLRECCDQRAECLCQLVHSEDSMQAVFLGLGERGIEFQIPAEEACKSLHPKAICCVSFSYRTSFCAFVGCLLDVYQQESGERRLITAAPKDLAVTNLRQSFRVPVIRDACLETIIRTTNNRQITVSTLDIAEGGMEIQFPPDDEHGLAVGNNVAVELRFQGQIIQRKAEIRRLAGSRCGLYFGIPSDEDGCRQAATMHRIMLSIQQIWLKSRLK